MSLHKRKLQEGEQNLASHSNFYIFGKLEIFVYSNTRKNNLFVKHAFTRFVTFQTKQSAIQLSKNSLKIPMFKNTSRSSKSQLPRARIFPREETDTKNHACLTKQSAIQLSKNNWTSSKFHLPQASIFQHERKHSGHHACVAKQCPISLSKKICTSSKFHLPQARIFHHERKHTVDSMRA